MGISVVGSGGKTSLIKRMAQEYCEQNKKVFVTTSTHMHIEPYTLLSDDADTIVHELERTGFVMAGLAEGIKIFPVSPETYEKVCSHADVVLVEADGSRCLPLKFPNSTEPVIPDNVDEIIVVCGLFAMGQPAKAVCHRLELVKNCLQIEDDTVMTAELVQKLVMAGYIEPLRTKYPNAKVSLVPNHDGSLYQRAAAALMANNQDVLILKREWFTPQPELFICGGGHVAKEVAAMAAHLDLSVTVMDDRDDLANRERFPMAETVICDSYDRLSDYLKPNACYVVVTPDHKADLQCVSAILPTQYRYLGMIGSKRKVAATFENLRKAGFTEEQISSIFAPIGLDIKAVTPAEIAISILAQIIQEKNKYHAASVDKVLLERKEPGMLCVITEKQGSAPRGVGSMMFVGENEVLGSIGGGEPEYQAIRHAKENPVFSIQRYTLNRAAANGLDMICGGSITVAFIPVA